MMSMQTKPEGAVPVFVLGILSLITGCFPLGIVAWLMGNSYESRCRAAGVQPEGIGVAGKIIGIVVTVLSVLGIVLVVAMLALGAGGAMVVQ